jgi:hypothetical protein
MRAILNFLGFGHKEIKKAHSYKKAVVLNGSYYKRDDGEEFFISSLLK